jgi:hypothetical protein
MKQEEITGATETALNFSDATNFKISLGTNITISSSEEVNNVGQSGVIVLVQDGTGGRTVALPSEWKTPRGDSITYDTGANNVNMISYYVLSSTEVAINYMGDFS